MHALRRDVRLLQSLGELAQRWHPNADKIRPLDVVAEVEKMLENELDLQREGANASLLKPQLRQRRRSLRAGSALGTDRAARADARARVRHERDDIAAIDAAGIDRKKLAAKGVRVFYEQVFRDNFFHADAHPGNIWVDPTRGRAALHRAGFRHHGFAAGNRPVLAGAEFHRAVRTRLRAYCQAACDAGWMPPSVRLDELEAAVRTVCEPYFTRPLSQISLAELVVKLFQTARASS
jgi:ubiquinone biosynthesis protein